MLELEEMLNYRFSDKTLIETALTHPSYGGDHGTEHYQRLEFLGDAVLQLAVSRALFYRFPDIDEGRLTRARASIVCEESLCETASKLGLGRYIRLSAGEAKSGGRQKPSILADVMEAIFAAIYLDGGTDAAFGAIERVLGDKLSGDALSERPDYKSKLQIILQRERGVEPVYELISAEGEAHKPVFTMRVTLNGESLGEGTGHNKQSAQQEAARKALEHHKY